MKRRSLWFTALLCAALVLSGCGSSSDAEETAEEEVTTEETSSEDADASEESDGEDGTSAEDANEVIVSSEDASELLLEWKTTQYFTEEAVAEEDIEKILEAGINTTSAMNGQPWHFTAVTDEEVMEEISSAMSFGGGAAPAGDFSEEDLPEGFDPEAAEGMGTDTLDETLAGDAGAVPDEEADTETLASDETAEAGEAVQSEEGAATSEIEEGMAKSETTAESTTRSKAALGDTPLAIIVSCADGSELDAGQATQSMFIEARLLGYGAKIVSSPTMVLNGDDADYYKELLGIPEDYSVVSVLLVGYEDTSVDTSADGVTGASERMDASEVVTYVE